MVAHPLDVLGAKQQVDTNADIARVFHHVGEQLAEQRVVDRVDLLVAAPHPQRLVDVAPRIGVEHVLDLGEDELGHVLDPAHHLLQIELAVENHHALGDVLGEIADPLEVVGDAERADDVAQVDRHRLAPRDGEDRLLLDLALQEVDLGVLGDDALGQVGIVPVQRIDGVADLALRQTAHLGDHARQFLEIGVERLVGVLGQYHLLASAALASAEAAGDVVLRSAGRRAR